MSLEPPAIANIKNAVTHLVSRDNERGGRTYLDPFQYLGCDFLSLALPTEIWGKDRSIPNYPIYS